MSAIQSRLRRLERPRRDPGGPQALLIVTDDEKAGAAEESGSVFVGSTPDEALSRFVDSHPEADPEGPFVWIMPAVRPSPARLADVPAQTHPLPGMGRS